MSLVAVGGIRHAFFTRLCEWELAVILFLWGGILLRDPTLFEGQSWIAFRTLSDEATIGATCMMVGAMRLLILAANGSWRPMYHLRAIAAILTAGFFFAITIGFASSGHVSTWMAVYPVFVIFDIVNALRAAEDAARVDRSLSNAREAMDGRK